VPGRVEPVGAHEVRVVEPELGGLCVHQVDEALQVSIADVERERVCRVVRALDQRGADQVAHGQPLAGADLDRRLADDGRARADGDDVGQTRVLERHEHRHQLRDARDGDPRVRAPRREHVARGRVLDQIRPRRDGRRPGVSGGNEDDGRSKGREQAPHARYVSRP
jgi:hypothetical protein